jgi:predicted ATPase/DNA-binding SARP family transcriptional activator
MGVDIRLLGGFEVTVDGLPVPARSWRRRHAAALVKLLALRPGHRMPREQVLDALWPDLTVAAATPRLHKAAHYARTAVGHPETVVLSGDVVALLPDQRVQVDVERFETAATPAEALAAYGGDLLPDDLYDPWTAEHRDRLRLRHRALLREAGRWEELVAADPADEEAQLRVVRALARDGDRRGALLQLERLESALAEELGVRPGEQAEALRQAVLAMPPEEPARTPDVAAGPTPVPAATTRIVGRSADVAAALRLLDQTRILTFLGPGGVGKTTLAAEVARRRSRDRAVEACFVDLTLVSEADLVPGLVAAELGLHRSGVGAPERLLQEALRSRDLVLLLDNFEHVVDAASLVSLLAAWSAGTEVLVTSRARLRVEGEQVLDVAPLELEPSPSGPGAARAPDAVRLFEQAARAVDPAFELAGHLDDVTAICRALDGLPLAIKLAAGHVRTLPPSLLRQRLALQLGSQATAPRDAPERQRTIPATVDWSLDLLGPAERRLFRRLAVFAGPVGLNAVEEVCGGAEDTEDTEDTEDVVDSLGRLVDQSLVRRFPGVDGVPRFGMLELLKERGAELLRGDEERAVRERHARHVAARLETVDELRWTELADRWIDVTSTALPEIRAAHAWAQGSGDHALATRITAALGTFWHREGNHVEGRRWVEAALPHLADHDDRLAGRLLLAAGLVTWPRDQLEARAHWEGAVERFRRIGDRRNLAYTLGLRCGTFVGDRERYREAVAQCEEALRLGREVGGDGPLVAQTLNVLGELARVHGDDELARAAYTEGMAIASSAGDRAHLSVFLANLSYLADHAGDYVEARRLGCEALRLCWSLGRRMMAAWTVSELAGPEIGLGHPEKAARLVGAAEHALETLGASRHPGDLSEHDRVMRGLRAALGEDVLDARLAEGARLPLADAVRLALAEDG